MLVAVEQDSVFGGKSEPIQYADILAPLGTVVAEYRIAPGEAITYTVAHGQYIQIIDVCGSQCS
ncbi:MAG: hypothetical protein AAFU53_20410, partial [Cyanobacteria bacterium J06632_3]